MIVVALVAVVAAAIVVGAGSGSPPRRTEAKAVKHLAVSRCVGAPRVGAGGTRTRAAVPILMYHVILPAPAGAPYPGLYVTPSLFAAQMHALAAAGYHAVTMNEVWDNWHHGTPLPRGKPIVISFDNGYESQYREALPVLRALGWVGVENLQLSGLPPSQGGLSERQVRALVCDGWELDTQGYSHADLPRRRRASCTSRSPSRSERIRALYHVHAGLVLLPLGPVRRGRDRSRRGGGIPRLDDRVTGLGEPGEDPYRLPRLRVLGGTSPQSLLSEIEAIRDSPPPDSPT